MIQNRTTIALALLTSLGFAACSQSTEPSPPAADPAVQAPEPAAPAGPDLTRGPAPDEPVVPAGMVEVTLKDDLDGNLNGYCLDIVGGGRNIDPSGGLQAHTCYSYRGSLGSDQAVDPALLAQGTIKVAPWNVCATTPSTDAGAGVSLADCDGSEAQTFVMAESGTISPASAPGMCFTAGEETSMGRGGTSPHQIKTLTLQPCSADLAAMQEWRTRESDD